MRKEMGNQNTTAAIQQDSNIIEQGAKSSPQENISAHSGNQQDQLISSAEHTKEVESGKPLEESSDRCELNEARQHDTKEQEKIEEVQPPCEARDQLKPHEGGNSVDSGLIAVKYPALMDTSFVKDDDIQEEQTALRDNEANQNRISSDSEPLENKEQGTFDGKPVHESTEGPLSEHYESSVTTRPSSLNSERETRHSELESDLPEDLIIQEATNITGVVSPLTLHPELLACEPEHPETIDLKHDPPPECDKVDAGYINAQGGSDPDNVKTSHISEVEVGEGKSLELGVEGPFLSRENTISVVESLEPVGSFERSSSLNDKTVVSGVLTLLESESLKDIKLILGDQMPETMSNGYEEIIQVNDGNSEDDIKDMTENLTNFPNADTNTDSAEPTLSIELNNKDELLEKNTIAHSELSDQDQSRCFVISQASELDSTKPSIEGFIFTDDQSRTGNSQIERCPSFNFDIKNGVRREESNHSTPLLYQNKPPMRSLSSPRNVLLGIPVAGSEEKGQEYCDMFVKEKTIILERTDSEKSRTPLLGNEKEEEVSSVLTTKNQKQELCNGHLKGDMPEMPTVRQKHKTRPSFFSSCVCCGRC